MVPRLLLLLLSAAAVPVLASSGSEFLHFRADPNFAGDGCTHSDTNPTPRWSAHRPGRAELLLRGRRARLDFFVAPLSRAGRLAEVWLRAAEADHVAQRWAASDGASAHSSLGPLRLEFSVEPATGGFVLLEGNFSEPGPLTGCLQLELRNPRQYLRSNIVCLRPAPPSGLEPGRLCGLEVEENRPMFERTPEVSYFVAGEEARLVIPMPVDEEPLALEFKGRWLRAMGRPTWMGFYFYGSIPTVEVVRGVDPERKEQALTFVFDRETGTRGDHVVTVISWNRRDHLVVRGVWMKMLPRPQIACERYTRLKALESGVECRLRNARAFQNPNLTVEDTFSRGGGRRPAAPSIGRTGVVARRFDLRQWCSFSRAAVVYELVVRQGSPAWVTWTAGRSRALWELFSFRSTSAWSRCVAAPGEKSDRRPSGPDAALTPPRPSEPFVPFATFILLHHSTAAAQFFHVRRASPRVPVRVLRRAIEARVGFAPQLVAMRAEGPSGQPLVRIGNATGPTTVLRFADESGRVWPEPQNRVAVVLGDDDADLMVAGVWPQALLYYSAE